MGLLKFISATDLNGEATFSVVYYTACKILEAKTVPERFTFLRKQEKKP